MSNGKLFHSRCAGIIDIMMSMAGMGLYVTAFGFRLQSSF